MSVIVGAFDWPEIDYEKIYRILGLLQKYYLPSLMVIGSMGNCISALILLTTKLRRNSSSLYLAALALSDTGFLARTFIHWLQHVNISIANHQGVCQLIFYFGFVFGSLSAWLVVAFTVERFVAVCYPLHRQMICTTKRAKIIISSLSLISLILWNPWLWATGPIYYDDLGFEICSIVYEWVELLRIMNFIEFVSTFILPCTMIIILNTCISVAIWRTNRLRKSQSQGQESPTALRQLRVTKMLLIVSSVFLICNLPEGIIRCYMSIKMNDHTELEMLFVRLNNLLLITNYGMNFVLYCLSGQNFRSEVALLFRCSRNRQIQRKQSKTPNPDQVCSPESKRTIMATTVVKVDGTVTISCEPSTPRIKISPQSSEKNQEDDCVTKNSKFLEKILEGTSVSGEHV